jgi:integral membrane protein (TIGR01906 family)
MKTLYRIFAWLMTILLPFALTFLGLRLLLTHAFPQIEYRMPGFPADDYGFSLQDRLHWSQLSIDYLVNGADISFLSDLAFPNGTSIYNERELSHMHDVKNVVQPVLVIGYAAWFLMLAVAVWARWGGWWQEYMNGIRRGGWLLAGLVVILGVLGSISFWQFFTVFHELFFKGNSWLFEYTDTLIRLFPMRFWQDAFLFVGILDIAGGLALALGLRRRKVRKVLE